MALTADDARAYLLLAAQSTLGNQAIAAAADNRRLSPRAVQELGDRDAKTIATKVRAWLEENHPLLFQVK